MVESSKASDPDAEALERRLKSLAGAMRAAPPAPSEARRTDRITTCRAAQLEAYGEEPRACIIRNSSALGVRISVEKATELPYRVTLIDLETGTRQPAYVMWRLPSEAGLSFRPSRGRDPSFGKVG